MNHLLKNKSIYRNNHIIKNNKHRAKNKKHITLMLHFLDLAAK